MRIPRLVATSLEPALSKRDNSSDNSSSPGTSLVVAVVFVAVLIASLIIYIGLRILRRTHPTPPAWLPNFLKTWWTRWSPGTYIPTASAAPTTDTPSSSTRSRTGDGPPRDRTRNSNRDRNSRSARNRDPASGVDRVTSIRSIMTLPEYRPVAAPDKERTIGREGERAGIDVVVEFPETATEEEQRREEHMAALYEIRLARQLERAEAREAASTGSRRNRERNGSSPARGRRDGSHTSLAAALAAVHERDRRLSNVAYAEVGYARPDGSRVRASSTASDRDNLPLLSSGASMGHTRNISVESVDMFSARPSMEARARGSMDSRARPGGSNVSLGTGLDIGDERPPDYGGEPLEPPPDYEQLHEGHENRQGQEGQGQGGQGGHVQLPLLRVEAASPEPPRSPTYPPPVQ